MREATTLETGIWRLRATGMTYAAIAKQAGCTKGVVAGTLYRISQGMIVIPRSTTRSVGGCRWIHGEPPQPGWDWCDAPVANGGAWCDEHRAVVYRPFVARP